MNPALTAVFLSIFLLLVLAILPLVPSIFIYRMFPNTIVVANGPLSGLTLKSSGAFSIYVIVFLVLAPFSYLTYNSVSSLASPSWTIVGKIKFRDSAGNDVRQIPGGGSVQVTLSPNLLEINGNQFLLKVPEFDNRIPVLTFSLGDLGSEVVNFDDLGDYSISTDNERKLIKIETPITIRLVRASSKYSASGQLMPTSPREVLPVVPH